MKVKNLESQQLKFEELNIGDVFKYENNFYMRIEKVVDYSGKIIRNGVQLETGTVYMFNRQVVEKVNGTFHVEPTEDES